MPVPILSDGTPLTFEWLNAVANAINTLELNAEENSDIVVDLKGNTEDSAIKILTGVQKLVVNSAKARGRGSIFRENISYGGSFADAGSVVVVAMVTSTNATAKPVAAGVAVGKVTEKNFEATIQMFDDTEDLPKDNFELRFIAVGKKPAV